MGQLAQLAKKKSTQVNDNRKKETELMTDLFQQCFKSAAEKLRSDDGDKAELLTNLILQGLLLLCESDVKVRCLPGDRATIEGQAQTIQELYSKKIKEVTKTHAEKEGKDSPGVDKEVTLTLSENTLDPEEHIGGVILECLDGKVTINNTLAARLELVQEKAKPVIRKEILFNPERLKAR